jgi:transposase InsO family protein
MKYEFITEYSSEHSIALMCRVLMVSRSGYYSFAKGTVSARETENRRLLEAIRTSHTDSRETYGSPRVHQDLIRDGKSCSKNRVARLMAKAGIMARMRRRYRVTTRKDPRARFAPDKLQRSFVAERPHQIWTSDITYIWTDEGWSYLAVVMDLYSRMIVGWATGSRIDAELVCRAVNTALVRHQPATEIIFHSDRGSQYTSNVLRELLATNQPAALTASQGLSCYDNAVTESFFHTLKTESVNFERYPTRESAHRSLFDYIEIFYNRQRRHSSLGYSTPMEVRDSYQAEEKLNSLSEGMG